MNNNEEILIQISNLKLAAKCWGNPNARPLLGLHGWLDNASTFDHLAPLLGEFRFISLDLPGHGYSDHRPPGSSYHFIDMVVDVLEVKKFLGWDRFSIIGHSMGAGLASYLAGTIPNDIDFLILIDGLGPITQKSNKMPEILMESSREWMSLLQKKKPIYPDFESAVKVRYSLGGILESSVRTLVSRGLKPVSGGYTWNSDPRLKIKSRYYFSEDQCNAFLKAIEAPVLLIDAESSEINRWKESFRKRTNYLKNLDHRIVKGEHHLHLDDPESVALEIKDFLKNIF